MARLEMWDSGENSSPWLIEERRTDSKRNYQKRTSIITQRAFVSIQYVGARERLKTKFGIYNILWLTYTCTQRQ
jgi:hypothetical protein